MFDPYNRHSVNALVVYITCMCMSADIHWSHNCMLSKICLLSCCSKRLDCFYFVKKSVESFSMYPPKTLGVSFNKIIVLVVFVFLRMVTHKEDIVCASLQLELAKCAN